MKQTNNKKPSSPPNKVKRQFIKNRPDVREIERDLIQGTSYSVISSKYNLSRSALSRYKKMHLVRKVNATQVKKDLREGDELLTLLETYINNVNMVANACLDDLRDPDDPNKLYLGVKAEDIDVSYYEWPDNKASEKGKNNPEKANPFVSAVKPIKKRDKLQVLLNRLNDNGLMTESININAPDRAHTLLKASQAMNKHIHLFGELKGLLGNVTINITNQPVFIEFTQQVIQCLAEYPEARLKVAEQLRTMAIEQAEEVDSNDHA